MSKTLSKQTRRTAAKPDPTKKTTAVVVELPEVAFGAFKKFADHFGLTPEMVMEAGVMGQLSALGDSTLYTLALYDDDSQVPESSRVSVLLRFIPEALVLLELVAKITRRPLGQLLFILLMEEFNVLGSEMSDAIAGGGLDTSFVLEDLAKGVLRSEFESRRGRLDRNDQGISAWEFLNLQHFRPLHFAPPVPKAKQGGPKR